MKSIPINNLLLHVDPHKSQIMEAMKRVIDRGWLVLGPEVIDFESAFASYLGIARCVSVANGTDAIELALKALGVVSGDRVATVANAGMYSTSAMLAIGAEPEFMDVNLESQNVSLAEVRRVLEIGVKAVVVTHLYGQAVVDIEEISRLCRLRGVALLEDCAQVHGALLNGRRVGTFGDAASFSFYPTKNLGALGDGGAVVTQSEDIAERVKHLRQYGWGSKYEVKLEGGRNSRLDELQAAVLMVFLPHLDAANARRRQIAQLYEVGLRHDDVLPPNDVGDSSYVAHLYVVRSNRRDALRAHLKDLGIASEVHYPIPDYRQPLFGDRFSAIVLESTERLAAEILTLPCYPEMSNDDVVRVVEAVNGWKS